jgi:protein-tyrosine phosphatase
MERLFTALDERHGGVSAWLRAQGWTDEDAAALRRKLLD